MKSKQHPYARHFYDLIVYQKARELQQRVFEFSKTLPREEAYSLTDQIRRASRSIGAQIAEAWAKRDYERHFVSKLTDADAEQMETQHWLIACSDCGYVERALGAQLFELCLEIGRILGSVKSRAADFCPKGDSLHECPEDFFAPVTDNTPF